MFGGTQQGGGGKQFVNIAALYPTKKGNWRGKLEPKGFKVLMQLMKEAFQNDKALVFIASPDQQRQDRGRLSAIIDDGEAPRRKTVDDEFSLGGENDTTAATGGDSDPAPATARRNPPKDPIDDLLRTN